MAADLHADDGARPRPGLLRADARRDAARLAALARRAPAPSPRSAAEAARRLGRLVGRRASGPRGMPMPAAPEAVWPHVPRNSSVPLLRLQQRVWEAPGLSTVGEGAGRGGRSDRNRRGLCQGARAANARVRGLSLTAALCRGGVTRGPSRAPPLPRRRRARLQGRRRRRLRPQRSGTGQRGDAARRASLRRWPGLGGAFCDRKDGELQLPRHPGASVQARSPTSDRRAPRACVAESCKWMSAGSTPPTISFSIGRTAFDERAESSTAPSPSQRMDEGADGLRGARS